jgi:hypothetical protein
MSKVDGERSRGRDKNAWKESVAEDMRMLGFQELDVQYRLKWRKGIVGNHRTHASMDTTDLKL